MSEKIAKAREAFAAGKTAEQQKEAMRNLSASEVAAVIVAQANYLREEKRKKP